MKIFNTLQFCIYLSTKILIILLASGRRVPRTPTKAYFRNFQNFRESFDKLLKRFQK